MVLQAIHPVDPEVLAEAGAIIRDRCLALNVPVQVTREGDRLVVEMPGLAGTQDAEQLVGQTAQLTFRPVIQQLGPTGNPPTTPQSELPNTADGTAVIASRDSSGNVTGRYELGPVLLNGTIIHNASAVLSNTGQWQVNFTTTSSGSAAFDAMAAKEFHQLVAIVLDNNVISAPEINATAFHGSGQITGTFREQQAKDLALVLNYGSLPVPVMRLSVQTFENAGQWFGPDLHEGSRAVSGGLVLQAPADNAEWPTIAKAIAQREQQLGVRDVLVTRLQQDDHETVEAALFNFGDAPESDLSRAFAQVLNVDSAQVSLNGLSIL